MPELRTGKGAICVVDEDVWEWARHKRWYLKCGYFCNYTAGVERYLHQMIMEPSSGCHTHHRDRNRLDCRRSNLVVLTPKQHRAEHREDPNLLSSHRNRRRMGSNTSGYRGVSWHCRVKKWAVQLQWDGRNRTVGLFTDPDEAALVYDAAVIAFVGHGYTNLILLKPEPLRTAA